MGGRNKTLAVAQTFIFYFLFFTLFPDFVSSVEAVDNTV